MNTMLHDWARHFMWNRLELLGYSRKELHGKLNQFQPNLLDYELAEKKVSELQSFAYITPFPSLCRIGFAEWDSAQQEKEKKMSCYKETSTATSVTINHPEKNDHALNYIHDRLQELTWTKENKIEKLFDNPKPATIKEAKQWLADGNYRMDTGDMKDDAPYYGLTHYFNWGKTAPDYKKRDQLIQDMYAARTEAMDTVHILTDEASRLQALKDFESKTFN